MSTFVMLMLFAISYVPTLIIIAVTPYITRKTEVFGVSIPKEEQFNPEIMKIKKEYLKRTLLLGGLLCAVSLLMVLFTPNDIAFLFLPVGTLLLLVIMYAFYLRSHNKVKSLKSEMRWMNDRAQIVMVDTGFRNKRVMASPLWFGLYALVITITIVLNYAMYDTLPGKIPMHWNIRGEVDRWVTKSYKALLFVPAVQAFMTIIMVYSYWLIGKSKQAIDPASPEISTEQNRRFRYRWSLYMIITGLVLLIMFGAMQLFTFGLIKNQWVIMGLPLVVGLGIALSSIILSLTTGQGGSRLYIKKTGDAAESKVVRRDEDKYWKLGLFYFNPDDPSFIVEKRFGIGWTNNWARPISWVLTIGLIVFIIGFTVITAILAE